MKKMNFFGILCGLFLLTLFTSCNNDDSPSYEKKSIDNPELVAALQKQGFSFDKNNSLELNNKVTSLTSLDLSNSELKNLKGLEVFPKLTEVNLSGNDFGPSFDFSQLPAQVKKVNLSNNEIYDYKGLINVNFETADIQVLRKLDKLVLPYTARWNMEALPFYFKKQGATDIEMQNKEGQPEKYNTLREVPDPITRKYMQDYFSSVMTEDGKIDISKRINTEQENTSISIERDNVYNVFNKANNIDGIEFIVNSPFYKGTQVLITGSENKYFDVPYLKPQKSLNTFGIATLNLNYIDWSSSEGLRYVGMYNVNNLKTIDLSYSKLFMQAPNGINQAYFFKMDNIEVNNIPDLETIKMPDLKKPMPLFGIILEDLPKLQNFDMSKVSGTYYLSLLNLPMYDDINVSSLNDAVDSQAGKVNTPDAEIEFSASERICNIPSVKDFIIRMGKKDRLSFSGDGYDYRHFYQDNTANRKHYVKQHSKGMYNRKDLLKNLSSEIERQNSNK